MPTCTSGGAVPRVARAVRRKWARRLAQRHPGRVRPRGRRGHVPRDVDFVVVSGDIFDSAFAPPIGDYLRFFEGLEPPRTRRAFRSYLMHGQPRPADASWQHDFFALAARPPPCSPADRPGFALVRARRPTPVPSSAAAATPNQAWPPDESIAEGVSPATPPSRALAGPQPHAAEAPFAVGRAAHRPQRSIR